MNTDVGERSGDAANEERRTLNDRPRTENCESGTRSELDRWILSRLNSFVSDVTQALESYDAARVVSLAEAFVDELSNWYVRLSRRRFWKNEADEDKESAYSTLYTVLVTLTKLLAPVLPFMSEAMYQNLVRSVDPDAPGSVHLCDWPVADLSMVDQRLMDETDAVMKVVRLGRSARNAANMKVRQPLGMLTVKPSSDLEREAVEKNRQLILDELNIKAHTLTEDVIPEGLFCAEEDGTVVGVDTALTQELVNEGLARDFVRKIQNMRKESGFKVDDRIMIEYHTVGQLAEAIRAHEDYIKQETLADSLTFSSDADSFAKVKIGGEEVGLNVRHEA